MTTEAGAHCPNCGNPSIARVGNWLTLPLRRLLHRNVYACHRCMTWWRDRRCDPLLPTDSGGSIRLGR